MAATANTHPLPQIFISLREQVLIEASSVSETYRQFISDLIMKCHSYKEEGHSLQPKVIICENSGPLPATFLALNTPEHHELFASKFLKETAPLSGDHFLLFLNFEPNAIAYGVGLTSDLNKIPNYASIEVDPPGLVTIMKVYGGRVIQTRSLDFLCQFDSPAPINQGLDCLLNILNPEIGPLFKKVIQKARRCHGFLIAVGNRDNDVQRVFKKDPTSSPDWIAIPAMSEIKNELGALDEFLLNLLSSDGITVIDRDGTPFGFRGFCYDTRVRTDTPVHTGGARTRAFQALKNFVDDNLLIGAFYQSQDGQSSFYSKPPAAALESSTLSGINPSSGETPQFVYLSGSKLNSLQVVTLKSDAYTAEVPLTAHYTDSSAGFKIPENFVEGVIDIITGVSKLSYLVVKIHDKPLITSVRPYLEHEWVYVNGSNFLPKTDVVLPDGSAVNAFCYSSNQIGFKASNLPEKIVVRTRNGDSLPYETK